MPGRPDIDLGGDAHDVAQAKLGQPLPEFSLDSIAGIGQHAVTRSTLPEQVLDLRQGDRCLGRKPDVLGNPGLVATRLVFAPILGQVQATIHRQAAALARQRDTDGHLAVVLLA